MRDNRTPPGHTPKSLRVARGLTQAELAEAVGLSIPPVAAIEAGEHVASETFEKVAKGLKVSLSDLVAAWERARDHARSSR